MNAPAVTKALAIGIVAQATQRTSNAAAAR